MLIFLVLVPFPWLFYQYASGMQVVRCWDDLHSYKLRKYKLKQEA